MNLEGLGGSQIVSAWITNQIGPGTTAANVLEMTTFAGPIGDAVESPFIGLTLPAGTYFVVLSTIGQPNETGWDYTETPTVITGPGDTYGGTFLGPDVPELGSFAPSYSFISAASSTPLIDFKFSVTNVPEPATLVLLGLAFAGMGFARRRKLKGQSHVAGSVVRITDDCQLSVASASRTNGDVQLDHRSSQRWQSSSFGVVCSPFE
jgi:PEP-CTERM motif-containing protein